MNLNLKNPFRWLLGLLALGLGVWGLWMSWQGYRADSALARARSLLQEGRAERALAVLRVAERQVPGNAEIALEIGNLYLLGEVLRREVGGLEQAVGAYERAGRINPQESFYTASLGQALALSGRLPEAERAFRRALGGDPYNHEYLWSLGWIAEQAGDRTKALEFYRKTLEIYPDYRARADLSRLEAR